MHLLPRRVHHLSQSRATVLLAAGLLTAGLLTASTARAQEVPGGDGPSACPVADTAEARQAGRGAAGRPTVAGYAVVGFAAGVPTGFMAPLAIMEGGFLGPGGPETRIAGAGAAGVGATLAVASRRASLPSRDEVRVRDCAPEYRALFRDAYAARLRQRRVRAAAWGGATGAVTGLGFLIAMMVQ